MFLMVALLIINNGFDTLKAAKIEHKEYWRLPEGLFKTTKDLSQSKSKSNSKVQSWKD